MKKTRWNKSVSLLLAVAVLATLPGCSSGGKNGQSTTAAQNETTVAGSEESSGETQNAEEIVNHAKREGLPITDEEITLIVGVNSPTSSYQLPWEDTNWIKMLQEASGVKLEFRYYESNDSIALMYTSRDYPDIAIGIGSDKQIQEAALGGDIVPLNDLMAEWSPNWSSYFAENDLARRLVTFEDGNIYSLPQIAEIPYDLNLRDMWLINKVWLDELGLEIPKTTDEYYNVLKAFKENAGKGSIPEDVIPLYTRNIFQTAGGALDIFGTFGVRTQGNGTVTLSDEGKIEYNYATDDMIEPLLYLRRLYEEELIPYDCLTCSQDDYMMMTRSGKVGSFFSYANPDVDTYIAMAPVDSGNGKQPLTRGQVNWLSRNKFTIFSTCQYPEVAMRLADLIADPVWTIQCRYGTTESGWVTRNEDDTFYIANPGTDYWDTPDVRCLFLLTEPVFNRITLAEDHSHAERLSMWENVYKDYVIPMENRYQSILMTEDQTLRSSELSKDLNDCRNTTFANWMLNGGIEEGWDDYVKQMQNLGLEEYLSILQEAYDSFNSK